ncbi:hypothetical protein COCSADRAFT_316452 [Bipolaris sorokiniana ND90Pr]|uniref:Uncharacterized protein n=1 Tax=Cochliobolus sativus (strain ND90Pr / ATCC 201652) TaxID=665912 RepID=M2RDT2_COCSN|nr:uncharacterized protein COCSADRAFT_316452 [Bipolaris sorokiniana ND90Pr]EMD64954.1 hypothetical protein COCSADRAFT_316452 [Bipolaris sorokiniana ND90Pr]
MNLLRWKLFLLVPIYPLLQATSSLTLASATPPSHPISPHLRIARTYYQVHPDLNGTFSHSHMHTTNAPASALHRIAQMTPLASSLPLPFPPNPRVVNPDNVYVARGRFFFFVNLPIPSK